MAVAAISPERHDTVALAWTKAAILDCLAQARQALERFAGEPGDLSMLAFVVDNLHQVHGCLRMLELRGATRLAEELELFAKALAEGQVSPGVIAWALCFVVWSNCRRTWNACAVPATTCHWSCCRCSISCARAVARNRWRRPA